jgi:serine protease AprX
VAHDDIETLRRQLEMYESQYDADIVEDVQYQLEGEFDAFEVPVGPEVPGADSLDEMLQSIHADEAWETTRGEGVAVAVVDTGINGARPEFPVEKRRGQWAPAGQDAWTDYQGHGTMCACIAAGTRAAGGEFDGAAPGAGLISCRTSFYESEIVTIYDFLTDYATAHRDERVVSTNSFGRRTGRAPEPPRDSDLSDALTEAIDAGVTICFSAGNYHGLAGGHPESCSPASIWLHKRRADVLIVAACRPDGDMWWYSSRGPGQFAAQVGMARKPDVTAPTPPDGRLVYGDKVRSLPNGWGTSGACPQAAGVAALLLSADAGATAGEVLDAIRWTAVPLGHGFDCEGHGLLHAAKALSSTVNH